jgi:xanthine/CO dehydrogenase XdhC/CoxF family maturation factor
VKILFRFEMKEIRNIIRAYEEAQKTGQKSVLATVVHLEGSSYRRPGARMLVTEDGQMTGAISGGCLEGDALRKAMLVLNQRQSKLVTYDTSDEDDITIGVQLGCAGIVRILFEPLDSSNLENPLSLLKKADARRQKSVLITLYNTDNKKFQLGTCLLWGEDGSVIGNCEEEKLKKVLLEDAEYVLLQQESFFKTYTSESGAVSAFIEYLAPPVSVVIVGAGNDAIPLSEMADILGWEARVVDGRPTHARAERFVSACQVLVARPEKVLEQISIDDLTFFVLMTHNYNYDLAMLKALLQTNARYIGVLGPKKKLDRMLDEIRSAGINLSDEQLKRIYGPVGFEIGAETPDEIALSILAEIKAVLAGKPGPSLRDKTDVIHSREETLREEKKYFE